MYCLVSAVSGRSSPWLSWIPIYAAWNWCVCYEYMNNHLLVWFVSAHSLIHRIVKLKIPLEIIKSQPTAQSRVGERRLLRTVSSWVFVCNWIWRFHNLSHRETCSSVWPPSQWKCHFLCSNAIFCASVCLCCLFSFYWVPQRRVWLYFSQYRTLRFAVLNFRRLTSAVDLR